MKTKNNSSKKLEKAIDAIVNRLEKAEFFVLEQAPDICKETIREKLFQAYFGIVACLIFSLASASLSLYFFLTQLPNNEHGALSFLFGLLSILPFGLSLAFISDLISLKTAPKLMIIRELKKLT